MIDYAERMMAVQSAMQKNRIDLLFLPLSADLHYLTGVAREEPNFGETIYPGAWLTGAWIPPSGEAVLTVPRMLAEFHLGMAGALAVRVLPDEGEPLALANDVLTSLKIPDQAAIAMCDRGWAETVFNLQKLRPAATFAPASSLLMPLRRIKDEHEIAILRKAGEITEAAYASTLDRLHHGMTNLDLITEVNHQLRKYGAFSNSFATSFYNMGPHYPFDFSNREELLLTPLEPPVSISYDFGAVYAGYCYDFGRSVYFGDPSDAYLRSYELVLQAQAAGILALSAGRTCAHADAAARAVIDEGGYGHAFRHRLGHGIGLDVHEPPFLAADDMTVLEAGMCFTVEPSIFLPHQFGVRVEDVVVVRAEGGEPLTDRYQHLFVVG